jgi:hypothetical protein
MPTAAVQRFYASRAGGAAHPLFVDDASCAAFVRLLAALPEQGAQVLAFALAPQAYALVAEGPPSDVKRAVRRLEADYARAAESRHRYDGPVWAAGAAFTPLIRPGRLQRAIDEVHTLPVVARVAPEPTAARWSSARAHAGVEPWPAFLTPLPAPARAPAAAPAPASAPGRPIALALADVAAVTGVPVAQLSGGGRRLGPPHHAALYWLSRVTGTTQREIAAALNLSPAAVSRALARLGPSGDGLPEDWRATFHHLEARLSAGPGLAPARSGPPRE